MPDLTVVYEAGILRPSHPIDFPEGQTLQIRIIEPEDTQALRLEKALQPLVLSGALTLPPKRHLTTPLPEIQLVPIPANELETYGINHTSQNLLSDAIIEDRGPH
jgi:predicted DNA-binding antitoxin AbrB/MazE fold protein